MGSEHLAWTAPCSNHYAALLEGLERTEMGTVRRTRRVTRSTGDEHSREQGGSVVDPTNIVISGNVGDQTSIHGTASRQTVRIRQQGNETHEESETTETRF